MKKLQEIYVSTDIEADGYLPGKNSMLSFASAAFDIEKNLLETFERNLHTLSYAEQDPETMKFWEKFPEEYAITRQNCIHATQAMLEYRDWLNGLKKYGTPIFVCYPGRFDLRFIDWYSLSFIGESLLGRSAIDLKTLAYAVLNRDANGLKVPFRRAVKKNYPRKWIDKNIQHNHTALADSLEQGSLGINILREHFNLPPVDAIVFPENKQIK